MSLLSDRDLLSRLLAFDTTSHLPNREAAGFLADYLEQAGVEVATQPDASGEKINLIARAGPAAPADDPRGGLIISGHLDTVPATEPDWQSNPFTLNERDGRYYARGSCDMKGFDALAVNRLAGVDAGSLTSPLMLILTHDEEIGSVGARRLAENWPLEEPPPRAAVIGEPTSLRVVRMHKGHLKARVTIHGVSAHSGSPHLGASAIEPAGALLVALQRFRENLEQRRSPVSGFFPAVPHPVLNVARITGGSAINIIPDQCVIEIGVRPMPGDDPHALMDELGGVVAEALAGREYEFQTYDENPPLLTDASAPIHSRLCEMMQQPESIGVSYASDGGWLSRLDIDCVLFGPGSIEVAHRPNEFVPIDEFNRAGSIIERLIEQWCMVQR